MINIERTAMEIAEFTGETVGEVMYKLQDTARESAKQWLSNPRESKDQIEDFYKTNTAYIYDIAWVNTLPMRVQQANDVYQLAKLTQAESIVDYGAGCADLLMYLREWGYEGRLVYWDLPSITKDFAMYRSEKRQAIIDFPKTITKKHDILVSIDVLEHVYDVEEALSEMVNMVKDGGYLYLVHAFFAVGEDYPCHLPQHKKYNDKFPTMLKEMYNLTQVDRNLYKKDKA